jgi:hypothetical protein
MNKRKFGGIWLTLEKNALSIFYLSSAIHGAKGQL